MIKIVKDTIDPITTAEEIFMNCRVVDSSYTLNVTEEQVHSILVCYTLYGCGRMDFLQYRDYIKYQIVTDLTIWSNQSVQEKQKAYELVQKPASLDQVTDCGLTMEQVENNQINLVEQATECRKHRLLLASAKVSFILDQMSSFQLNMDTFSMMQMQAVSQAPHLTLWLKSEANPALGIDYTTTGFASKSYYNETAKNVVLAVLEK